MDTERRPQGWGWGGVGKGVQAAEPCQEELSKVRGWGGETARDLVDMTTSFRCPCCLWPGLQGAGVSHRGQATFPLFLFSHERKGKRTEAKSAVILLLFCFSG